jgi:lipoate-protein ligase A
MIKYLFFTLGLIYQLDAFKNFNKPLKNNFFRYFESSDSNINNVNDDFSYEEVMKEIENNKIDQQLELRNSKLLKLKKNKKIRSDKEYEKYWERLSGTTKF